MAAALLWPSSKENYFKFAKRKILRDFPLCFFTGRAVTADGICWPPLPCGEHRVSWGTNPLRRFAPALPKGEPRLWRECFLPLPLKDFPRSGEDVAQRQKGDKVSPKVTERAHPLPCGELPPQRLRGLQIGEAKKMRLAKRLAFFRFDFCFGVTRGEQPLVRGSSASKSLALFWFSFVRQKRTFPARRSISRKGRNFFYSTPLQFSSFYGQLI